MEAVNSKQEDLAKEDLIDNVEEVAQMGDLSPNQTKPLKQKHAKDFFKYSKGLKQGDPLSPTLFIIAAEEFSRSLKELLKLKNFKLFGMPRGSPKLNHLAFADDMIIICKAEVGTLQPLTSTLEKYELVSGQRINKEKSALYFHEKVSNGAIILAEMAT
ncbi:uncharacterized mitochondrial protein AtMg01250-like, partial [Capsicum annuum]|uniref:uncharacterized mitochondrial protein AtMg01250-like n=1 Tax=Capsicum annuum TaxID=4072 RepID=UPI001FB190B8